MRVNPLLYSLSDATSLRLQFQPPLRTGSRPWINSYFIGDQFKVTQWVIHSASGEDPRALVMRFMLLRPILNRRYSFLVSFISHTQATFSPLHTQCFSMRKKKKKRLSFIEFNCVKGENTEECECNVMNTSCTKSPVTRPLISLGAVVFLTRSIWCPRLTDLFYLCIHPSGFSPSLPGLFPCSSADVCTAMHRSYHDASPRSS